MASILRTSFFFFFFFRSFKEKNTEIIAAEINNFSCLIFVFLWRLAFGNFLYDGTDVFDSK